MTDTWIPPDEWLNVYEQDGSYGRYEIREESQIDAAVTKWIETKTDTILHLTFIEGEEYNILASAIRSWYRNTAQFRNRERALTAMLKEESGSYE